MQYRSGKRWENIGSYALRQHRAGSHCALLHGYSPSIEVTFDSDKVDERGWVVDFGSLKSLKEVIESLLDHTLLVAEDDPFKEIFLDLERQGLAKVILMQNVSAEAIAQFLFYLINGEVGYRSTGWLSVNGYPHVWCSQVRFEEKPGNIAIYQQDEYHH